MLKKRRELLDEVEAGKWSVDLPPSNGCGRIEIYGGHNRLLDLGRLRSNG